VSLPYYKRFPRDFLEGTIGLSFEVKGAYAIVLDLIYMRDGRLPDDARYISGQLGCSVRKWTAILAELVQAGKLQVVGGIISNFRADYLTEESRKYQDKQAEIAGNPRKNKPLRQPQASQSEPEPYNNARALLERADDRFDEALNAYPARGVAVTSVPNARRLWTQAAIDAGGEDVLLAAVRSFAVSPDLAKRDHGAPGFHRWLLEERWRAERKATATATTGVNWRGPPDIRAAVVGERGEAFASSYLDPAGWSDDGRVIAATGYAAEKLRGLSSLNDRTISVEQRQTA
jgi:uncharacterized protein YdaU (DUF1376 family)